MGLEAGQKATRQKTENLTGQKRRGFGTRRGWQLATIVLFALGCIIAVSLTLTWRFEDNAVYGQQVGEVAKDDVIAPKALTYVSQVQSQKAADEAANNPLNNVYRRDESLVSKQRDSLNNLLIALTNANVNFSPNTDLGLLLEQEPLKSSGLSQEQLGRLLNLPGSQWTELSNEARTTFNIVMASDISPDNLNIELGRLKNDVYTPWNLSPGFTRLDDSSRNLVIALVYPYIRVNNTLDEAATKLKRDNAAKKADQVNVSVLKGQSLVRRGEILTPLQVEQLQQLGLRSAGSNWQNVVSTVGVITGLILLMVFYFSLFRSQIWTNPRLILFIGLTLLVSVAGMRILFSNYAEHPIRAYLLPLAAVSMVLAALLDVNLAIFLTAILALMGGYVAQSPEAAAVFFVGGAAGAFMLYKAERTMTFVYAGAAVALSQFAVGLCFNFARNIDMGSVGLLLLYNLGSGLVATSLAFFIFSALGKLFGVTTVIQLLELAHPNQPLLRRLMREAPGTYHHSILVSNLAEQAAERLMGDALLARVGAYYHDIGKLSRPDHFIDNQGGMGNIHDNLDPRESARIIKAHVEDGVALARKNHLPRKVVDIIHQHHGTCLIAYFYHKAVTLGLDIEEIDFRYPGPKPQTKVAAIVMLSDGVEAAVRANIQSGRIPTGAHPPVPAAENPTTSGGQKQLTIEAVVNKIIDDRIRDHQLDECDLTLKDIDELRHLFVEILAGIYHPRIVYPDTSKPANPANGNTTTEPESTARPEAVEAIIVPVREIPLPQLPSSIYAGSGAADGGEPLPGAAANLVATVTVGTSTYEALPNPENRDSKPSKRSPGSGGIGGAGRPINKNHPPELPKDKENLNN